MRRSAAPSMRKAVKRPRPDNSEESCISSTVSHEENDEDYEWGTSSTSNSNSNWQDKQLEIYENILANKRIFNIVWRDITTKKNKTWKGDGTLEVNISASRAVLKDETGKYLGSSGKIKINELAEDYEMTVGSKEIQILEEIKSLEGLENLKKQQFKNRSWGDEECLKEETKKPKGAFIFKCPLHLDKPQLLDRRQAMKSNENRYEEESTFSNENISEESEENHCMVKKFICLLRPSELQQYLLEKAFEIYEEKKSSISKEDLFADLQNICNHPSIISQSNVRSPISRTLQSHLPEWSEMGPYDSSKLEFLLYFLDGSKMERKERSIIVASDKRNLNMLQGLCDYLSIKCLRLVKSSDPNITAKNIQSIKDFNEEETSYKESVVLITEPMEFNDLNFLKVSNLIYFNCLSKVEDVLRSIKNNKDPVHVYQLITAGCYEEYLYKYQWLGMSLITIPDKDLSSLFMKNEEHSSDDLINSLNSYNMENISMIWQSFDPPYDPEILLEAKLEKIGDNLIRFFKGFPH